MCASDQFLVGHLEATVTVNNPHGGFGVRNLSTHTCRNAVAHGAQTSGANEVARVLLLNVVCTPHLVLTNAGDVVCVRTGQSANTLEDVFGRAETVGGLP